MAAPPSLEPRCRAWPGCARMRCAARFRLDTWALVAPDGPGRVAGARGPLGPAARYRRGPSMRPDMRARAPATWGRAPGAAWRPPTCTYRRRIAQYLRELLCFRNFFLANEKPNVAASWCSAGARCSCGAGSSSWNPSAVASWAPLSTDGASSAASSGRPGHEEERVLVSCWLDRGRHRRASGMPLPWPAPRAPRPLARQFMQIHFKCCCPRPPASSY